MAKWIHLPAGLGDATPPKGLVQPLVPDGHIVDDRRVVGRCLVVHAPAAIDELQLTYEKQSRALSSHSLCYTSGY